MTFSADLLDCLDTAVLARQGQHVANGEIRFRCPYPEQHRNSDVHASARWNRLKACWHCDVCSAGSGALKLARLLGVVLQAQGDRSEPSTLSATASAQSSPSTFARACLPTRSPANPGSGCGGAETAPGDSGG
jgi:hypothetical protein